MPIGSTTLIEMKGKHVHVRINDKLGFTGFLTDITDTFIIIDRMIYLSIDTIKDVVPEPF